MPKSAKKKASADFTKTKAKLGKGKQLANNATDTSFKSRTIALPQQSINSIHSSSSSNPTNHRNETLDDLLVQTRHYNAAKRKDGILAIKSLLIQHPHLKTSTLNFVLPSLIRLIPDEEPIVRKALANFLSWYFETLPTSSLIPYQNSMILFTTSAMSHIFNHVRLDAVNILDILLKFCPDAFKDHGNSGEEDILSDGRLFFGSSSSVSNPQANRVTGVINKPEESSSNAERVLKCYLNLLGIEMNIDHPDKIKNQFGTASTTSTDLSSGSKLLLFRSFATFLKVISNQYDSSIDPNVESSNTSCPTWFFKNSFKSNDSEFEIFENFFKSDVASSSPLENGSTYSPRDPSDSIRNHHHLGPGSANDSNMMDIESQGFDKSLGVNDLNKELRGLSSMIDYGLEDRSPTNQRSANPHHSSNESGYSILSTLLHPLLLTTYLDSFPTSSLSQSLTLSSSNPTSDRGNSPLDLDSELISSIIHLSLILWRGISKSVSSTSASSDSSDSSSSKISKSQLTNQNHLLSKMFSLFPFGSHNSNLVVDNLSSKARETLKEMNLNYCELIALSSFLSRKNLSSDDGAKGASTSQGNKNQSSDLDHQILKVGSYLISILDESAQSQSNIIPSSNAIGIETYRSLLPITWLLLNIKNRELSSNFTAQGSEISGFKHSFSLGYEGGKSKSKLKGKEKKDEKGLQGKSKGKGNEEEKEDLPMDFKILQALLNHYEKLGASNKSKVLAFEFIARLSILHTFPGYNSPFNIKPSSPLRKSFSDWFKILPKYLWELGGKDPCTSEKVLKFLKEIVARSDGRIFNSEDIDQLTKSLSPFFHISHPARGEIKGPYRKLPLKVQTRAEGLVYFLLEAGAEDGDSAVESEAEKKLRDSAKKAGVELIH